MYWKTPTFFDLIDNVEYVVYALYSRIKFLHENGDKWQNNNNFQRDISYFWGHRKQLNNGSLLCSCSRASQILSPAGDSSKYNEQNWSYHVNLLSIELNFHGFAHSIEVLNESYMIRLFVSFNSIKFFIQIAKNPRKIPINFQ